MRFRIVHEIKGRMRIHVSQKRMSYEEADTLQYYLESQSFVLSAKDKISCARRLNIIPSSVKMML